NANARFAINRVREILEGSGNNPGQISSINDQTGGIINLFDTLNNTAFVPATGVSGTKVRASGAALTGTSNCRAGVANTYCGVALDLQSDLNGNGLTSDDITPLTGSIFGQNIITSEHLQIYLDTSVVNGFPRDQVELIDMNVKDASNNFTRIPIAEFIVNLQFLVSVPNNTVSITVTARSNRAVAVENVYERRFRYATLTTRVRIRNMNANVARLVDPFRPGHLMEGRL